MIENKKNFAVTSLVCASLLSLTLPPLASRAAHPGVDPLQFPAQNVIPLTPGQTFLTFMQSTVKPRLDLIANTGFQVRDSRFIVNALQSVDDKVQVESTKPFAAPTARGPQVVQQGSPTLQTLANAFVKKQQAA